MRSPFGLPGLGSAPFGKPGLAQRIQNLVNTNGAAYLDYADTQIAQDPKMTFGAWIKPISLATAARLFEANSRSIITQTGGKVQVIIRDSANGLVYNATTTNVVLAVGVRSHVYVAVDLSVPSAELRIDGVAVPMSVVTAIGAGNGNIGHNRQTRFFQSSTGTFPLSAEVGGLFFTTAEIIAPATLYGGGIAPDLTGVGAPKVRFGGNQLAAAWNAATNLGSIVVTTAGGFTNAPFSQ